jgi:hypothetical protein
MQFQTPDGSVNTALFWVNYNTLQVHYSLPIYARSLQKEMEELARKFRHLTRVRIEVVAAQNSGNRVVLDGSANDDEDE